MQNNQSGPDFKFHMPTKKTLVQLYAYHIQLSRSFLHKPQNAFKNYEFFDFQTKGQPT